MPELPEVETLRLMLQQRLPGRRIQRIRITQRQLRWPVPAELEARLDGSRFERIARRGKYLLIHTDRGCLIVHLGMSGTLRLIPCNSNRTKPHDHLMQDLDDGHTLVFNDPRRFGSVHWTDADPLHHVLIRQIGPEPLDAEAFSGEYLQDRCRRSRANIKSVLLNSRVVAGIGNIYACEALFEAGIDPCRRADRITTRRLNHLRTAVQCVLQRALEAGGTSIRDFSDADGRPGYFAQELRVYGREKEPCHLCGRPIQNVRLQGRSTFFCRRCQR